MQLRFLIPACVLASQVAAAQRESQWRFGAVVSAPTRLVKAASLTAPDSVFGHVDLGFGIGAEVGRAWDLEPRVTGAVTLRATTATVKAQAAGTGWSPGRSVTIEATARVERAVGDRAALIGALAASHWSGPAETAPFKGIGAALLGAEAGASVRPGGGPWRIDVFASMTRFGASEASGMATGFVWRLMAGLRRAR